MDSINRSRQASPSDLTSNTTHMLDLHILDYLKKRNLVETALVFKRESQVLDKAEAPAGLLYEWWSIFWDIYIARTNPSSLRHLSANEVQKAKLPLRPHQQQQLQQLHAQQQSMQHLVQHLIKEKGLPPEQAAQIAQQITAGKIRMSELNGLGSMSSQEQMLAKLQAGRFGAAQFPPLQNGILGPLDEGPRGSTNSFPSPSLSGRPPSTDPGQSQQLLATVQALRSADRGNEQGLNSYSGGAHSQPPLNHLSSNPSHPWPNLSHSMASKDGLPSSGSALLSPHSMPPELHQHTLQNLQQHQHQQGAHPGGDLHRGMSWDLQPGSSRQSSGTIQRNIHSPTLAPQGPPLSQQQLMLLHQHMQQQKQNGANPQHSAESDSRRQLLARLGSQGLLRPGSKGVEDILGGSTLSNQEAAVAAAAALHRPAKTQQQQQQQQEQQRFFAELHAMNHRQQQQQQARQGRSSGMIPDPNLGSGPGERLTPSISELDRQITSSGSGQKRNSPATSTAAGSSMQNGRATPVTITSGPRNSSRPNKGKSAAVLTNKKRKHSGSTSPSQHSESQDGPSSNASGGSGPRSNPKQGQASSAMQPLLGQGSLPLQWDSPNLISKPNALLSQGASSLVGRANMRLNGAGMNDAAAALDSSHAGLLNDIMGVDDNLLDPAALLGEDPTDATSWPLDGLGKFTNDKELSNCSV